MVKTQAAPGPSPAAPETVSEKPPVAAPIVDPPLPSQGGSYVFNPATGALRAATQEPDQ
ncbi:MAG: hypothetical protein ACK4S2_06965 [Gemmobacter sp.]|uniref:hypothetical protein n=1 Tax=Gemmobacter sp. TaxID=1898957 RepID=UPI003919EF62